MALVTFTSLPWEMRAEIYKYAQLPEKMQMLVVASGACGVVDPLQEASSFKATFKLFSEALEPLKARAFEYPGLVTPQRMLVELSPAEPANLASEHITPELWGLDSDHERDLGCWLQGFLGEKHPGILETICELNHHEPDILSATAALQAASWFRVRWYPRAIASVDAGDWDVPGALLFNFSLGDFTGTALVEDPDLLGETASEDDGGEGEDYISVEDSDSDATLL